MMKLFQYGIKMALKANNTLNLYSEVVGLLSLDGGSRCRSRRHGAEILASDTGVTHREETRFFWKVSSCFLCVFFICV